MKFPHDDPYLIDGRPWGLGAVKVDSPGKGWICPGCGSKAKKDDGRHIYIDGDERCTACARAWCDVQARQLVLDWLASHHPTEVAEP